MRIPSLVVSDGLEEKLIALFAEYQVKNSGVMMKRGKKQKEIAEKLNLYQGDWIEHDVFANCFKQRDRQSEIKSECRSKSLLHTPPPAICDQCPQRKQRLKMPRR